MTSHNMPFYAPILQAKNPTNHQESINIRICVEIFQPISDDILFCYGTGKKALRLFMGVDSDFA